jgi:hypothetical protein
MTGYGMSRGQLIVVERSLPVVYGSWSHWRRERQATTLSNEAVVERSQATEFCAHCWGAGRILSPARNGEGLVPRQCSVCEGRGSHDVGQGTSTR